ncbi:MAG: glutaredoxin family protein [Methylophilus sp.]
MSRKLKFFMIGTGILLAMEWRSLYYYLFPLPDFGQGKVTLYATDWCPYCEKTRKLLEQEHIPYREYNIETSEEGRSQYQRLAGKGVPVLLVDGEVVRGYHEKTIVTALAHWQNSQALASKGKLETNPAENKKGK